MTYDDWGDNDYRIMAPGTAHPVIILRRWFRGYIMYFEHECYSPAVYNGLSETPEGAFDLFWKHRILGEPQEQERKIW